RRWSRSYTCGPGRPRVDVAWFDLRDRQFVNGVVGVALQGGRPLVAMLLTPGRPVRPDVSFGAFLEGRQHHFCRYGFSLFACSSPLRADVNTSRAAITFDTQPRSIPRKPRILQ